MSRGLTLLLDESKESLNGISFSTRGYNDRGNSEDLALLTAIIPANDANPLNEDPPALTPELSWGIKVVEEVNISGCVREYTTPIMIENIEDLKINFFSEYIFLKSSTKSISSILSFINYKLCINAIIETKLVV